MIKPSRTPEYRRFLSKPFSCGVVTPANRLGRRFEPKMCSFCGSVTLTQPSSASRFDRHFCDSECRGQYKKHHNKTEEYRRKWAGSEYGQQLEAQAAAAQSAKQQAEKDSWRCCSWCGKAVPMKGRKKYCGDRCASAAGGLHWRLATYTHNSGTVSCAYCGKNTFKRKNAGRSRYCSEACARKYYKQNRSHRKRTNGLSQNIGLLKLARKFRFLCASCGCKCVKPTGNNAPNEATLDHIVPLAKGGTHTWSNVRLLCRQCNGAKSDAIEPGTQLLLQLAPT